MWKGWLNSKLSNFLLTKPLFHCFLTKKFFEDLKNKHQYHWNFIRNKSNIPKCFWNVLFSGCPELQKNHQWGSEVDSLDKFSYPKSCQEACLIDSDCADGKFLENHAFKSFNFYSMNPCQLIYFWLILGELCCTNSCGGHTCYRSKSGPNSSKKSHSVCQDADNILKCVYDKIKKRVCAQDKGDGKQKQNHWISSLKRREICTQNFKI